MRLWIECAHRCLPGADGDVCPDVVRTFQNEERFFVVLVDGSEAGVDRARSLADRATALLTRGRPPDAIVEALLTELPRRVHVPFSFLLALPDGEVHAVECDAPPLFLVQDGQPTLPPVMEHEADDHLIRRCRFRLEEGDHLAIASAGFLHRRGARWGWPEIAVYVRRWTDTNCDAQALLEALLNTYRRLNQGASSTSATVVAMHARPMRTATVWSGPPSDPAQDGAALNRLMAEPGTRVICGGTTAQIAARLLQAELEIEPRPPGGWDEVPPTYRLADIDLVTEGLVTLRKAREQMADAIEPVYGSRLETRDWRLDGAARLARALLAADRVHFIVGLAVNPQQAGADGVPLRKHVVEDLMHDLEAQGKLVAVVYV